MSFGASELCGKSEGKIFQDKIQPCGMLLNVKAMTYFRFKLQLKFRSNKNLSSTECPTRYRTRHFFNNSNTNEDIETKFEQEYVRCVRNSYTMR